MSEIVNERRIRRPEFWVSLAAICLVSVFYYGIRAAAVIGLAAVTAVLTDFVCLFLQNKSYRVMDLSNAAAAVVMALMFPATIPYSIVILSTIFAVAVGIHVFGSRKNYLFPPSAVGYLFALICWQHEVLRFPPAGQRLALFGNENVPLRDSLSHTLLQNGVLNEEPLDLLLGAVSTPMGTGCILLLLAVFAVLLVRRAVSFWACLGFSLGVSMMAMFGIQPIVQLWAASMLLFAMIFLIGDHAVMPIRTFWAFPACLVTGLLTGFLLVFMGLEYAPVIAVMLSCPVWQAFRTAEKTYLRHMEALDAAERMQQLRKTADSSAPDAETEAAE